MLRRFKLISEVTISIMFATLLLLSEDAIARAGGGGLANVGYAGLPARHDCGTYPAQCLVKIIGYGVIILLAGLFVGLLALRTRKVSKALLRIRELHQDWSEEYLKQTSRYYFLRIQRAWRDRNFEVLKDNVHPALYEKWEKKLRRSIEKNARRDTRDISIHKIQIVGAKNYLDDERDEFTVYISAKIEINVFRSDGFGEFWTFEWERDQWMLRNVAQSWNLPRYLLARIINEKPQT